MTIIIGVMMVALAISMFYTPNKIVSGGVSGIATILFHAVKGSVQMTNDRLSSFQNSDGLFRRITEKSLLLKKQPAAKIQIQYHFSFL